MLHLLWTLFRILSEGESTFHIHSETLRSFLLQNIDKIDKLAKGKGHVLRDSYVARERTEGTNKHIILCVCTSNGYPYNFHLCLVHCLLEITRYYVLEKVKTSKCKFIIKHHKVENVEITVIITKNRRFFSHFNLC